MPNLPNVPIKNQYSNSFLVAQNIARADGLETAGTAGESGEALHKLDLFVREKMFPLKTQLNKLPVVVTKPKKTDGSDDPNYSRNDNLGRLESNQMKARIAIAEGGLRQFKSLQLQEKAKNNIEAVRQFVEKELAKDKIKLSDLVREDLLLADEKNIETQILNHVAMTGPEQKFTLKKKNKKGEEVEIDLTVRDVAITTRQNKFSGNTSVKTRRIEFLKLLDNLFNEGLYQGRLLQENLTDEGLLYFLANQVHNEKLTVNKEGTSLKEDLEIRTRHLTPAQKSLVAYYLWSLAEYARINTRQFILLTHLNFGSIEMDAEKLGDAAYLQNTRYLYNILGDCTGNLYDLILTVNEQLDPDIAATMVLLDKIKDGDGALVGGDFTKAQESYESAAVKNNKRRNKTPDDFYTQAIQMRQRNLNQAIAFAAKITGRTNPLRDGFSKIKIEVGNANAESLMGRALKATADKELPVADKAEIKTKLEEIVKREHEFLRASDEEKVKAEVFNSETGRPEKVEMTKREYAGRKLTAEISALDKKLNELPEIKERLVNTKKIKEQLVEAKRFLNKHHGETGVLADPTERSKAENHVRQLEAVPEKMRKGSGLEDFQPTLERLKKLSRLPVANPQTIASDLKYSFTALKTAYLAYFENPNPANLQKFADIYVTLMILLENDSTMKEMLQETLDVKQTTGDAFWKYALFDASGQNIFYKTYKAKSSQSEHILIEAYASGSEKEPVYYSIQDVRNALKENQSQIDNESKTRLVNYSKFFRDDMGRILGIDDYSEVSETEVIRVVFALARLMNASGAVSAAQLKSSFEKNLDKEIIEIGAADFRYSVSENVFKQKGDFTGLSPIQARLDERKAKHYRGNSAELFFADLFLAFDPKSKEGLVGTDSMLSLSLEQNKEVVPRSAMNLTLKTGQIAHREVLREKLLLLRQYVNQDQPSDVRGKQYKKIRLALIAALAESLQIKLD